MAKSGARPLLVRPRSTTRHLPNLCGRERRDVELSAAHRVDHKLQASRPREPLAPDAIVPKERLQVPFDVERACEGSHDFKLALLGNLKLLVAPPKVAGRPDLYRPALTARTGEVNRSRLFGEPRHAAAFPTKPSAVTLPPDALMMTRIVSRVMFCPPLRMRLIEASLMGGSQRAPNSAAVMPSRSRY